MATQTPFYGSPGPETRQASHLPEPTGNVDMAIARRASPTHLQLSFTVDGKAVVYTMKPSTAAALIGRLAEALANQG